jgi:hypothetical protein
MDGLAPHVKYKNSAKKIVMAMECIFRLSINFIDVNSEDVIVMLDLMEFHAKISVNVKIIAPIEDNV